jgi:hypothetical protein
MPVFSRVDAHRDFVNWPFLRTGWFHVREGSKSAAADEAPLRSRQTPKLNAVKTVGMPVPGPEPCMIAGRGNHQNEETRETR